jgi:hypothetical protein
MRGRGTPKAVEGAAGQPAAKAPTARISTRAAGAWMPVQRALPYAASLPWISRMMRSLIG